MAKKQYTVIQLPEWDGWRVAGSDIDWQIQELVRRTTRDDTWEGARFYSSCEYAIGEAFERSVRELGNEYESLEEFAKDYHATKDRLLKAVRKAVDA